MVFSSLLFIYAFLPICLIFYSLMKGINGKNIVFRNFKFNKVKENGEQTVMSFTELLNYMYRDATQGDQYGVPTYGMYNLATNFTPVYDQSFAFSLDPTYVALGYNTNYIFDEELDQLSMDMVYGVDPSDREGYLDLWQQFILKWNELLPEIPLYSNVYYTIYPEWLNDFVESSLWEFNQAIVYASIEGAEG